MLSAQATDASVNRATPGLFEVADTPEKIVALGETGVTEKIKTIGLYRNKAKNLVALSKKLIDEHDGKVPDTREELETLPGVGRKTANVVLNVAFGQPTIGIDTHAFRVANRTGLAPGKTPLEGRGDPRSRRARALQAQLPSLADPARPLCVQGAQARMLALHHRRHLPVQAEDARARLRPGRGASPRSDLNLPLDVFSHLPSGTCGRKQDGGSSETRTSLLGSGRGRGRDRWGVRPRRRSSVVPQRSSVVPLSAAGPVSYWAVRLAQPQARPSAPSRPRSARPPWLPTNQLIFRQKFWLKRRAAVKAASRTSPRAA